MNIVKCEDTGKKKFKDKSYFKVKLDWKMGDGGKILNRKSICVRDCSENTFIASRNERLQRKARPFRERPPKSRAGPKWYFYSNCFRIWPLWGNKQKQNFISKNY
jgi:hypothetical protein